MPAEQEQNRPPRRRRTRFGWMIVGTLVGAELWSYHAPYITDGPTEDLWLAEYWFGGAIIGACSVVLVQVIISLSRKRFRARLNTLWLVELAAVCVLVGGFGQNWRNAQVYYDVVQEGRAHYREHLTDYTTPNVSAIIAANAGQLQSLTSSAIIYLSKAVATLGVLSAVYGLFAGLADLEKRLPERVDNSLALILVGLLVLVSLYALFMLGRTP
jgi:H+/Cl- antiporter ClcA